MESKDYKNRTYLSAIEEAKYLGISVEMLHNLAKNQIIKAQISASGQMRFDLTDLKKYEPNLKRKAQESKIDIERINVIEINDTIQKILVKNSM
jgi:hypothetical protein